MIFHDFCIKLNEVIQSGLMMKCCILENHARIVYSGGERSQLSKVHDASKSFLIWKL